MVRRKLMPFTRYGVSGVDDPGRVGLSWLVNTREFVTAASLPEDSTLGRVEQSQRVR